MAGGSTNRSLKIFINGKEIENNAGSMESAFRKVKNELKKLEFGTEAYNQKLKELNQLGSVLDDHAARMRRVQQASSFMNNFASALGVMSGAQLMTSAISKLGNEFNAGVDDLKTYSSNLAEMADVMELTDDQIKGFEERAKSLTNITLEGGQSIKTSAGDILEAFKLVAGARPELLEVEGGIESVTKSALILSRASGEDLATSVATLTTVMAQFGSSAAEADEIINTLAAGSKVGAAETTDVANSIKDFGLVAANSNITIAESVGLIETLADSSLKGSEAGTQLRNVLTKLAAPENLPEKAVEGFKSLGINMDLLKDKSVPFEERLKELAKAQGNVGVLAKAFGTENLLAAQILTENVGKFATFTQAVTGTTAAFDSANTKSKSFAVTMKDMKVTWDNIRLTAVKFLVEAALPFAKWVLTAMQALAALPKFIMDNRVELGLLAIALISFNAQAIAASVNSLRLAAVEKGRAIVTNAVAVAQRLLNAAMTANPIGLVITAVALLAAGFVALYNRSEKVRAGVAGLAAVAQEAFSIIKEAVQSFISGWQKLKDGDITGALTDFGKGMVIANPISLAITQGKRLGKAFTKGYADSLAAEKLKAPAVVAAGPGGVPPKPPKPPSPPGGAPSDKKDDHEKEKKELENHLAQLREIVRKHQVDLAKAGADDTEKGLLAIKEKYAKELAEASELEKKGSLEAKEIRLNLERLMAGEISEYKEKVRLQLEKKLDEGHKSEIEKIRDGYKEKFALISELEANGILTRQEAADKVVAVTEKMNQDILAKTFSLAAEQKAAFDKKTLEDNEALATYNEKRLELLGSADEKLLAAVNKQYDDLLLAAKRAGVEQIKIDELNGERREALFQAQLGKLQVALGGMSSAFGSLGDAIGQMIDQGGKKMEGWIGFQKTLAIAQVAFDTAAAISGIISKATSSSITWYDAIIGIASGVAAVLANMAKAKALLSTPTPKYQQKKGGGYHDVIGADDNKRYRAEQLGVVPTGMLPGHPVTILASEEGGEYFVSNPDMKKPAIASLVAQIDNISKGRSTGVRQMVDGGYTHTSGGGQVVVSGNNQLINMMMIALTDNTKTNRALLKKIEEGIPAMVGNQTTVDIFENFRKLNATAGGTLG